MKSGTFDPADLIMRPLVQCPSCKEVAYGVLSVGAETCERRCKRCRHSQTEYLPLLQKKVIYLDQFAISDLMKLRDPQAPGHARVAGNPFWNKLDKSLTQTRRAQLAIFPHSNAHRNESLIYAEYESLKKSYESYSLGVSFKSPEAIRHLQMACAVVAWAFSKEADHDFDPTQIIHGDVHGWSPRIYVTVEGRYPADIIAGIRAGRNESHTALQECFEVWTSAAHKTFFQRQQEEARAYGPGIIKRHLESLQVRLEIARKARPVDLEAFFPTMFEQTVGVLNFTLQKAGITDPKPPAKAVQFLMSEAFTRLPFLIIESSMYANFAMKVAAGQKTPPNQGTATDIEVVSTLLPYCDAMFVDRHTRALVADIPRKHSLRCATKLFSMSNREEFLEYLDTLTATATPDHLALVKRVYG